MPRAHVVLVHGLRTSATMWLEKLDQMPICGLPALSACLNWLTVSSIVIAFQ